MDLDGKILRFDDGFFALIGILGALRVGGAKTLQLRYGLAGEGRRKV